MVTVVLDQRARRMFSPALFALGVLFTLVAWRAHGFDVAYGGEGMHVALEAILGTVALVVGWLAWVRYSRTRQFVDLAVAIAFGVLIAGENILALALPTLLNHELIRPSSVWISAAMTVLSSSLLFLAAAAGRRRVADRRLTLVVLAVVGVLLSAAVVAVLDLGSRLSLPIDPALSPVAPGRVAFTGDPTLLVIEGLSAVLLLAAGAIFLSRGSSGEDALFGWLAPALIVGSLAAGNYALFPSLYSYWVYSGDILRLGFCALLAWGIGAELRAAVQRTIEVAVLEERRRLARDLHDGVAQELAFITAEIAELPSDLHHRLSWIRSAAERGLYESRRAIAALTMPLDRPLTEALADSVEEIAARSATRLHLDLEESVTAIAATREAVLRVAREAATNAVRHGNTRTLNVTLRGSVGGELRLEVADDGSGFDPAVVASGGFGLTSMREHVESTGGRLVIQSVRGSGARVEARWPAD